jgi:hypothetical protein
MRKKWDLDSKLNSAMMGLLLLDICKHLLTYILFTWQNGYDRYMYEVECTECLHYRQLQNVRQVPATRVTGALGPDYRGPSILYLVGHSTLPGLRWHTPENCEFEDSLSYKARPCIKKTKQTENQTKPNQTKTQTSTTIQTPIILM